MRCLAQTSSGAAAEAVFPELRPSSFMFNMKTSIYFSESQSPDSTITGNDTDLGIFKHGSIMLSDPSDIGVDKEMEGYTLHLTRFMSFRSP